MARVWPIRLLMSIRTPMQWLSAGLVLLMLVSLGIYGVTTQVEGQLIRLGKKARLLEEDNYELGITLDRIRAYQNVADASLKVQGLNIATEVIDVAAKPTALPALPEAPHQHPPRESYGY